jgi:hypothetical protein
MHGVIKTCARDACPRTLPGMRPISHRLALSGGRLGCSAAIHLVGTCICFGKGASRPTVTFTNRLPFGRRSTLDVTAGGGGLEGVGGAGRGLICFRVACWRDGGLLLTWWRGFDACLWGSALRRAVAAWQECRDGAVGPKHFWAALVHCGRCLSFVVTPRNFVSLAKDWIRIVTRSRGRPLLEPSRLMGYDWVASALCDRDSRGHGSPFEAGVHKGPKCMLVRTAHKAGVSTTFCQYFQPFKAGLNE